jgi:hypothetical protein
MLELGQRLDAVRVISAQKKAEITRRSDRLRKLNNIAIAPELTPSGAGIILAVNQGSVGLLIMSLGTLGAIATLNRATDFVLNKKKDVDLICEILRESVTELDVTVSR